MKNEQHKRNHGDRDMNDAKSHRNNLRSFTTRAIRKPLENKNADGQTTVERIRRAPFSPKEVFEETKAQRPVHNTPRQQRHSHHKPKDFKRFNNRPMMDKKDSDQEQYIPEPGDNIRIVPIGGVEEVGMNMTMVEIGDDIIVIDAGFAFKNESTPGIDYILPNTKYLEERKHKIRAILITHGHLDHVGGIPYIMERIGNPPLYTRNLTAIMIKKRQTEFPHLKPIDYKIVEKDEEITLGKIKVKFFGVTHSIPDCMGIMIRTPYGNIVNPGDFKLEHEDGVPIPTEQEVYGNIAKEKVLLLMTDSTNIENPGFSTPEGIVGKNLREIIKNTKGRLILAMFASHVLRILRIIEAAEEFNKKIVTEGRSMRNNIDIIKEAGILKIKKDTIIPSSEIQNYPPDRIVILATGGQGEEFSALSRMTNKNYKNIQITPNDTVVLSASIIPGNEKAVAKLKDNLARRGVKIIHYRTSEVYIHSTGHGNRGEIEWLHKTLKPKFFIPIHGSHYMLRLHAELAKELGMPSENIVVPDNGTIIEIEKGERLIRRKEKAPSGPVMVDGFEVGNMQEVVIRDRQALAQDGMFVIIATVNTSTGKLKKSPDIISRGFVYLRENQELLRQARTIIKKTIEDNSVGMNPINFEFLKNTLTDNVARFLFQKTAKRPLVIPVLLGI